ncbi:MAG: TonB C-terminal domain-containing protein [Elusimicrobia bacterium]|nr:TonB C-terminal domain-containing protein [Elusimicrobiota bacterium]
MTDTLRPYLTYSFAAHAGLLLAAMLLLRARADRSSPIYTIDFVGPSAVAGRVQEPAAKPAAAPAARPSRSEDLVVPSKKRVHLPKPSLASDAPPPRAEPEPAEEPAEAAPAAVESGQAISGAPGSGGIVTDLPNFPYPWYISQVRVALWNQWSSRMPSAESLAVVVFSIMPNGGIVDLRIEESSGDPSFDLAALGAARDAGPFPPLPGGYDEPFLKVHVSLKSGR